MVKQKIVTAFAPASCANINCGFDILGFTLESPGDTVILNINARNKTIIKKITGDNGRLPFDPKLNTATVAIDNLLTTLNIKIGIDVVIHKQMPLGSGLGSSAASSVAAIYALNHLLDFNLNKHELIQYAMVGELAASGAIHADNVAPSMLGGFTLIRSMSPLDIVQIPTPQNLYYTIIHPDLEINTHDARGILKNYVSMNKVIEQSANLAGLITGLCTSNYALIGRSLHDVIIEPIRSLLIPKFDIIKNVALESGAIGFGISGSGPSIFTLNSDLDTAVAVGTTLN